MYDERDKMTDETPIRESHSATLLELIVLSQAFTYVIDDEEDYGATDLFAKTVSGTIIKLRVDGDLVRPLTLGEKIIATVITHSPECDAYCGSALIAIELWTIRDDGRVRSLYRDMSIKPATIEEI